MFRAVGGRRMPALAAVAWLAVTLAGAAAGRDLETAQQQFLSGNYTGSVATIEKAVEDGGGGEERQLLLSQALMATGRYPEALRAMTNALATDSRSIRLRWQAREVFQSNGQTDSAAGMVDEILQKVSA